jgi:predicted XRE-type DNA-binding protein
MSKQKFDSVWEAIEDTPHQAESLKIRSKLMMTLQEHLKNSKMTQTEVAKLLGVTQPRVSDLMRGRIDLFSMESLVDMIASAGLKVEVEIKNAA